MKRHCFISYLLFALIGLILSLLSVVYAQPSPDNSVHFCAPFDYEQWQRDHPRPAGKQLAALKRGEPRTVRMIYFLPKGRPYDAALVDTIKTMMRRAQDWFAERMEGHEHGDIGFRFEADAAGEPLVLRVDGKRSTSYYNDPNTDRKVLDEIDPVFDLEANVYYITIDNGNSSFYAGGRSVGGVGGRSSKNGGFGMVPGGAAFGTVAHELGHAFGLPHDFRDDTYVMSYGYIPPWLYADHQLSACAAEFLAVHPYFNPNSPIREGASPTIEEDTSSPITVGVNATSIPVRVKVRDSDGLHQVTLFAETQFPHFAAGFSEVKACRGLEGKRDPVVEFDYDGFVPSQPTSDFNSFKTQSLTMQATDASGNVAYSEQFELVSSGFRGPIATFIPSEGFASSLFFSSDGKLLTLQAYLKGGEGDDGRVTLWDVSRSKSIATLPTWNQVQATVLSPVAALSPDGKLLALEGPRGTIKLWDVSRREVRVAIVDAHEKDESRVGGVSSLSFSPDGRLLASGGWFDSLVKLWDASSGEHVATVSKDKNPWKGAILSVVFSLDGRLLASGSENGTVELWDVSREEHVTTIATHENLWQWGPLSFSLDGRLLVSAGSGWYGDTQHTEVKLWDVSRGKSIATLAGSGPVSISPNGRLLASVSALKVVWIDEDGIEGGNRAGGRYGGERARLWDVSTGEPIYSFPPSNGAGKVAFSPDGRLLAQLASGRVWLWDVSEWAGEQTRTAGEQAMPHTLKKVSGDGQEGTVGKPLAKPFVVSVLDQNGSAFAGAVVTFSVTAGGGTLSATTATTNASGQAKSTLTLGSDPGTNTVEATVEGLGTETFTAIGQATTDTDGEEDEGEDQQESEETQTTTVELEGISATPDSVRENDEQATTITVTVTLDRAAATDETITLAIVSPTQGKTAKRGEDFDATLPETLTIARGQRTGTAQLTLTPKDNTTADGDKALGVQATSSTGHTALINIKIIDNDAAGEPQAWLTPDPSEVEFSADDPAWKTFTVHTNLDSVLVRANPSGSDPALEVAGGQQVPSRDYCPAEGNDRPASGRRDGWSLHVKACQAGQTKILLIDYDTGEVVQQYEVNVEASTSASASTALNPSYPNPFNSETVLSYTLPTAADIRLEVFTLNGQRVAVLYEGFQAAGYHTIAMDASDLASGVYLYRLTTPEGRFVQKFTLLR